MEVSQLYIEIRPGHTHYICMYVCNSNCRIQITHGTTGDTEALQMGCDEKKPLKCHSLSIIKGNCS